MVLSRACCIARCIFLLPSPELPESIWGKREIMKVQDNCKALGNRTWMNIKYQLKNMQCKI
ncbi:hypothetical protein DPMN_065558 [Dreissena polymorpha]|uniref:Uncharacterized protein n=1 Tax=Dreissena polymorpha TaxID=45954 RepID=A0A9D3YTS5_DREPO|nr:hypothetical protein DPMN_065558 [Dreissena polymorpha]